MFPRTAPPRAPAVASHSRTGIEQMMTTAPSAYTTVNGLNTHYVNKGSGQPLIVIHGGSPGACARVNWGANIDFFADNGWNVYAYDQPGYGRTDEPEEYTI